MSSQEHIDPSRWILEPRNALLIDGDNCGMFMWRWIGIYEGHFMFTARGKEAEILSRQFLNAMFDAGAKMILGVIPKQQRHIRLFTRRLGFRPCGEIETIEGLSEMYQLESCQ